MNKFKRFLKIAAIVLASIFAIIVVAVIASLLYLNHLAPIEHRSLGEYPSPDGKHICSVFVSNGGATTPYTVVAQVSGKWMFGKHTVYAVDNIEEADFRWVDNRTIRINGVSLDIYKDYYGGDIYDLESDYAHY